MDLDLGGTLQRLAGLGGPVLVVIGTVSVLALTVILVKAWQFITLGIGKRRRVERAMTRWRAGHVGDALAMAEARRAPHMAVLAAAIRASTAPDTERVQADVERVAREGLANIGCGLRFLEVLAQIAPLLGLFGTVMGMIEAFQALEAAGGDADPATLAGGIWVALLTTVAGLAVAMPIMLILSWFDGRVDRERVLMESIATRILTAEPADRATATAQDEETAE